MKPLIAAALASALAAPASPAAGARKVISDPAFDCPVPAGWSASKDADGARLAGPRDKNGIESFILVRRVPPGDKTFAGADAYLARQTAKPLFDIPGWKVGPVTEARAAGRAAKSVVKDSSAFVPPSSMKTKEVPIREEHVVLPASEGFYVLVYYAPRSLFAKGRPAFGKVLEGFTPKR